MALSISTPGNRQKPRLIRYGTGAQRTQKTTLNGAAPGLTKRSVLSEEERVREEKKKQFPPLGLCIYKARGFHFGSGKPIDFDEKYNIFRWNKMMF